MKFAQLVLLIHTLIGRPFLFRPDISMNDIPDKPDTTGEKNNEWGVTGVYNELRNSLMRFANRYFKRPQEIEDVVQEAFVKVIEARQTRDIEYPNSYLYQTVKNLALKQLDKSDYKLTDTLGDLLPESVCKAGPSLEDQFETRQKFELFCRAVRALPIKCQRVYILRKVYGFSVKEIAAKMEISSKTVEAHLTKAIVRCTDFIDADELNEAESRTSGTARAKGVNDHV